MKRLYAALFLLALIVPHCSKEKAQPPEEMVKMEVETSRKSQSLHGAEYERNLAILKKDAAQKPPKDIYKNVKPKAAMAGDSGVVVKMGMGYGESSPGGGGLGGRFGSAGGHGFGGIGIGGGGGLGGRFGKMGGRSGIRVRTSRTPLLTNRFNNMNTESYAHVAENGFNLVTRQALSTFSIDVDTASYSNIRRFLTYGQMPPKDAVRIEEMINYFSYSYGAPKASDKTPFAVSCEVTRAPWNQKNQLLRVGIKGRSFNRKNRPPSNLVFLIDVSGSMMRPNKLPLLKQAFALLLSQLDKRDRVGIVIYAGSQGVALEPTTCDKKAVIAQAIDSLHAGGSTRGSAGIQAAYRLAQKHFIKNGVNRVILATDGDFNVGITSEGELVRLIKEKAASGVFLSVLGFGMGNYKDSLLEAIAGRGNGNYAYIDTLQEAKKVLVRQIAGTLHTIAQDVKIQVEFNPARVKAYRLLGYENRMLKARDFNDDKKDAGEIGAGHTVTALYELVPPRQKADVGSVDTLKYQRPMEAAPGLRTSDELLTVKIRYKQPKGKVSSRITHVVKYEASNKKPSLDTGFAAAVAAFGMILRDSAHKGSLTLDHVLAMAKKYRGTDPHGYRREFISLVEKAKKLIKD
ncbi:VWA domain-containing protein [Myxococcota bacterium]|nr:VWA domain-containing protein [Myxococcota bacterium]